MELIDGIGSDFPVPGIIGIPPLTKLTLSRSRDAFRVLDWREWPHLRFLELHEPFRLPTSDHDPISLCLDWIQAPQLEILSLREVPCSSSLLSDYSALDHLLDRSKQLKIIRLEICDSCSDIDKNRSKFNTLDARLNERSVDLELNLYFVHLRGLDVLSERHFKILYENRNYNIKKLTIDLDGCSDPWVGAAVQQPRACSLPGVKELHYVGVGKRRIAALQWCMVAFNCPNLEILSLLLHQQDDPFTALHKFSGFISLLPAKCHWQIGPFEIDEEYIAAVEFVAREFHRCGVTLEWYWNEYLSYCPLEL